MSQGTVRIPSTLLEKVTAVARRLLLLVILLSLLLLPIIIVPYVLTQTPAVHSKDWLSRVLCAIALILAPLAMQRAGGRNWDAVDLAFGAFLLSHVLSALLSSRVEFCILENWHYAGWVALGWLSYRLAPTIADFHKIVACIAFAGIACAVYGLLTYAGLDVLGWIYPFQFKNEEGGRNFVHSFFGNPEYFGGYAAPVFVLCLSRCAQNRLKLAVRAGWILTALLLIVALALSGSRGAFAGVLVGCVLLVARQLPMLTTAARRIAYFVLFGALLAGLIGLVILSTSNPLNRRDLRLIQRFVEATDLQSASSRERLQFYALTSRAIADHPVFGAGLGTYRLDFFSNLLKFEQSDPHAAVELMTMELRNRLAEHPHNDYLEFWYELGTVGMASLLFIVALAFQRFFSQNWKRGPAAGGYGELQLLNSGFFASFACLLVNAASSFPLHMPARATLFWVTVGCFFASDSRLRGAPDSNKNPLAHTDRLNDSAV